MIIIENESKAPDPESKEQTTELDVLTDEAGSESDSETTALEVESTTCSPAPVEPVVKPSSPTSRQPLPPPACRSTRPRNFPDYYGQSVNLMKVEPSSMGFVQGGCDPCIYPSSGGELCLLGVYVDDIVLAAKTTARLEELKRGLTEKFDIKDMGKLHHFFDMKIVEDDSTGKVWIGQPAYTSSLLRSCGMEVAKPVS